MKKVLFSMLIFRVKIELMVSEKIEKFLIENERFCITLCDKFFSGEATLQEIYVSGKFFGVFYHTTGGQIFHCLKIENWADSVVVADFFEKYFLKNKKTIFSIVGEKRGTEIIRQAIEKTCGLPTEHRQEYFLMERCSDPSTIQLCSRQALLKTGFAQHNNCGKVQHGRSGDSKIFCATAKDLPELSKMQFDYEIEEVAYKGYKIDKKISELALRKNIKSNRIFFLKEQGEIVSKLSINAAGKNHIQIGGVFTKIEHRKKGFAKKLVAEFLKMQTEKSVVLFVKKENFAAQKLYDSLKFFPIGEFEIVYF